MMTIEVCLVRYWDHKSSKFCWFKFGMDPVTAQRIANKLSQQGKPARVIRRKIKATSLDLSFLEQPPSDFRQLGPSRSPLSDG